MTKPNFKLMGNPICTTVLKQKNIYSYASPLSEVISRVRLNFCGEEDCGMWDVRGRHDCVLLRVGCVFEVDVARCGALP